MYVNDSDEPRGTLAYVDNFPAEAAAELDALRARVAELERVLDGYRGQVDRFGNSPAGDVLGASASAGGGQ